jgi:hypothetical protein
MPNRIAWAVLLIAFVASRVHAEPTLGSLAVGAAGHAFDHLGGIGAQAPAAAASGAHIIYSGTVGIMGYQGLPPRNEFERTLAHAREYVHDAKSRGIRLVIGYVCATSIVKLDTFDMNWPEDLRAQFKTPPKQWLQEDKDGKPLPSWYGGDYNPACMNNPDWRTYEKYMVRKELETGGDGIFFDNPTVHPNGCYCKHCMSRFFEFVSHEKVGIDLPGPDDTAGMRKVALAMPAEFKRFRCTIARDFLAEIRTFARTVKPSALITCNNSLNTPDAFYSQSRDYGYNIFEMSKAEDFVVVEDMATQPRTMPDGKTVEYGPVYEMLHAISHGKPVVACTIAQGDYHTAPHLMRLAMAEAVAHGASYLSWPTWPENVRQKMIETVRPEADLLCEHADLLNNVTRRADAILYVPFKRWVETPDCQPLRIARELAQQNVQFKAVEEESLAKALSGGNSSGVLLVESPSVLREAQKHAIDAFEGQGGQVVWTGKVGWIEELKRSIQQPAVAVTGSSKLRVVVGDKPGVTVIHVFNLDVQRLSSFEDKVSPASDVVLDVKMSLVPFASASKVTAFTADSGATRGDVQFEQGDSRVKIKLPKVEVSTMLVINSRETAKARP